MNKHSIEGRKPLNNFQHCLKIMRITLSFLFFCILFSSASNSYSQKFTIKSKTASIKEVCEEIEKGSDYVFIFSDNCEKLIDKKVNVEANSKDVTEVLNAVLSSTGLTYKILDKQIVVYKSTESAPSVAIEQPDINIIQQPAKKQITGKVVDAQGDAIIGANIIEQGTTNGTVTDVNGNFSLDVENNATIRVSYIGYLEQSIATAGQSVFTITLLEDTKALDEVVVVGYGTQLRRSVSSAVSSIDVNDAVNTTASSISQNLSGRAAGLTANLLSAQPGGGVNLQIRGTATGRAPLIVIDGMPTSDFSPSTVGRFGTGNLDATLSTLNPNDIVSIDILKDASATSIYGSKAAGGVILITTKSGSIGRTNNIDVVFSGSAGMQKYYNIPEMLTAAEYMQETNRVLYEDFLYNSRQSVYSNVPKPANW